MYVFKEQHAGKNINMGVLIHLKRPNQHALQTKTVSRFTQYKLVVMNIEKLVMRKESPNFPKIKILNCVGEMLHLKTRLNLSESITTERGMMLEVLANMIAFMMFSSNQMSQVNLRICKDIKSLLVFIKLKMHEDYLQ